MKDNTASTVASKRISQVARRKRIASAVVAGKPLAQVAREEGVSRSWISREAGAIETRQIIAAMLHEQEARISSLFGLVLTSIEEAFTATRPGITKDGERYDLGPDHYARLAAVKRFIELLTAGRPIPKAPLPQAENRRPTWTEFQALLQASSSAPGEAD